MTETGKAKINGQTCFQSIFTPDAAEFYPINGVMFIAALSCVKDETRAAITPCYIQPKS
jgi:hypothetical protein